MNGSGLLWIKLLRYRMANEFWTGGRLLSQFSRFANFDIYILLYINVEYSDSNFTISPKG